MNEFIDLFDSSKKLDLEPTKLIEALLFTRTLRADISGLFRGEDPKWDLKMAGGKNNRGN